MTFEVSHRYIMVGKVDVGQYSLVGKVDLVAGICAPLRGGREKSTLENDR